MDHKFNELEAFHHKGSKEINEHLKIYNQKSLMKVEYRKRYVVFNFYKIDVIRRCTQKDFDEKIFVRKV